MYTILRSILFTFDAEKIHTFSLIILRAISWLPPLRWVIRRALSPRYPELRQVLHGITFPNPIGLAAGFDKNGRALNTWGVLNFGFAEIGTVTPLPQTGNPRPRLFRLPKEKAIVNRMGFNNNGAGSLATQLLSVKKNDTCIPFGVNIGKNKQTPLEKAEQDYFICTELLQELADFLIINVSSPNTSGLRELQNQTSLVKIVTHVQRATRRPIFIKISPDCAHETIDSVIKIIKEHDLAGIVATNTSTDQEILHSHHTFGDGGISGKPLQRRSLALVRYIRQQLPMEKILISVGGVWSVDDVWERIASGAHLVETYTGFVYHGPLWVARMNKQLRVRLRNAGLTQLKDLVGKDINTYSTTQDHRS